VRDFQKEFDFYKTVLGFSSGFVSEGVYADFTVGSTEFSIYPSNLMANEIHSLESNKGDQVALVFQVESVDKVYANLSERGVAFVNPPYDKELWELRVAHFRDPEGNLIEINQPLSG
jgi:uncharacterized glyoxalase superfamily protein PhnB